MKRLLKIILGLIGFRLTRIKLEIREIGSDKRPVGDMELLLEDLRERGFDCKTIMDVGANCAGWSRMAKRIFPSANFFLVEPQIEMKESLDSFCKDFTNSMYVLAGAGEKRELLTLTIWDDLAGSSFLVPPDEALRKTGKQREIEIIPINELIESSKIKIPDLIKLDIQGFELEALKGASLTFGTTEVYILEVSLFSFSEVQGLPEFGEVINFMLDRGYVVYDFAGFSRRPLDGALGQCDICFVKRNGLFRKSHQWK